MLEHLIESGFNYVAHNENWIIVQDPRWSNYRVYDAKNDPNVSDWIEADRHIFDWVEDAATFAEIPFK